jgi:coenzyme PQQ synthesis protein D (PqqD)
MPAIKPAVRRDLTVVELEGEAVIYDERTNELHHLNPTATVVFSLFDGTSTIKELAEEVGTMYSEPVGSVESHLRALYRQFKKADLIENGAKRDDG